MERMLRDGKEKQEGCQEKACREKQNQSIEKSAGNDTRATCLGLSRSQTN
jgi:hypothetical protein